MPKLICMSFDGVYVTDTNGTLKECQEASSNMGSKWFFYPFHFILTDSGKTIKEAGGITVFMSTGETVMNKKFAGKRLKTVIKKFEKLYNQLEDEKKTVDCEEFENLLTMD